MDNKVLIDNVSDSANKLEIKKEMEMAKWQLEQERWKMEEKERQERLAFEKEKFEKELEVKMALEQAK